MHEYLKKLLTPYAISDLKRYGSLGDGGYVVSRSGLEKSDFIYSYGIGDNVTFDTEVIQDLNKDVYAYDGTVDKFWQDNSKLHFKSENVNSNVLYKHIEENNHLDVKNITLKMDIEGSEYETLTNCDVNILNKFNQITLEVHSIIENRKNDAIALFERLNINHYLVHIHANNHNTVFEDGIANVLELTYVRKDHFDSEPEISKQSCPVENLDCKNYLYRDDIVMNWWIS